MPKNQAEIPELESPQGTLQFSFKHIECDHDKYQIADCSTEFWQALARTLLYYSSMPVSKFETPDDADSRHIFVFKDTNEPGFDPNLEQLYEWSNQWQFGVGEKRHGWRVYGLLVGGIFFPVWLDQNHDLYRKQEDPRKRIGS